MTTMKTTKFNAFDYFDSDEEVMDFLNECYHDDDPQVHILQKKRALAKWLD